jgi:HSP20 family molecular chaperone IbpA
MSFPQDLKNLIVSPNNNKSQNMMTKMKASVLLLTMAVALGTTEARRGSSWGGCSGTSRSLCSPLRHYDYHRRPSNAIDLVSEIFNMPLYTNSLLRQYEGQLARMENSGPRYAISESDSGNLVELSMEVPGIAAKDMMVEIENGNVLRVKGSRTIRERGSLVQSEFDQSFQLDKDIDIENIAVSLSSGILKVSAPKRERVTKKIPLTIQEDAESEDFLAVQANAKLERSETQDETVVVDHDKKGDDDLVITEEEDTWQ